ncbi:MAG: hypothetical protein J1F17_00465 [Oscillospiraceae bacterium]|nr:hypothetical protein [Oscillospiraceae bacterium]
MIINFCLFTFLCYILGFVLKMLINKPVYKTKYKFRTPQGNVKIIIDEK